MFNLKKDEVLENFLNSLSVNGLENGSIKNYKSDVLNFTNWFTLEIRRSGVYIDTFTEALPMLNQNILELYTNFLERLSTPPKTINRRLSSLRQLSKYLLQKDLITSDFTGSTKNLRIEDISIHNKFITRFKYYLELQKVSNNTIKNYTSDTGQFIKWFEASYNTSLVDLNLITPKTLLEFKNSLVNKNSNSTNKRKVASIKKFFTWAYENRFTNYRLFQNIPNNSNLKSFYQTNLNRSNIINVSLFALMIILALISLRNLFLINQAKKTSTSTFANLLTNNKQQTENAVLGTISTDKELPTNNITEGILLDLNISDAGVATISAKTKDVEVESLQVTKDSLIYITPITSTDDKVLYIEKKDVGTFKVAFNSPANFDVSFNWWVVNKK